MEYQQYITYSFLDLALNGLKGAAIIGIIVSLPFMFVFAIKKTVTTKDLLIKPLAGAAFAGLLLGIFVPQILTSPENDKVLDHNIAQKYNARITQMGHQETNRGAAYNPTDKSMHEVTIVANGESKLAYLQQDERTNEPTLYNYDTKKPLTDILKNQ
jgi:hypothetical protein